MVPSRSDHISVPFNNFRAIISSSSVRLLRRCQMQRTEYQRSEFNNAMQ